VTGYEAEPLIPIRVSGRRRVKTYGSVVGPAGGNLRPDLISGFRRLSVLPSVTFEPEIQAENDRK